MNFISYFRGVFQSLVEKHFPAPDRNRINRLLGLDGPKKTSLQLILDEDNSSKVASTANSTASSSKRKQSDQQPVDRDRKRKKRANSSEVSGGEFSDGVNEMSDDSDFKNNSCSDSEDDDEVNELNYDSNQSDDFNPFGGEDSDSDTDPWVARSKKSKPLKKVSTTPKKKPQSTQDKIQALITKKQTANASFKPSSSSTNTVQSTATATNGFQMNYGPPPKDAIERACEMKEELLKKIEKLGERLPPNTLDQLIDELGGPENVAVRIKNIIHLK